MKKIIEIQNYDDPSELKKLISVLQNRRKNILRSLGYDQINFNGSKYNSNTILPALEEMYKVDNCTVGNYYIYAHCNPLKPLSITTNLKPDLERTSSLLFKPIIVVPARDGVSESLEFHQADKLPCGSVSINTIGPCSARSAITAKCAAIVLLPAPPF